MQQSSTLGLLFKIWIVINAYCFAFYSHTVHKLVHLALLKPITVYKVYAQLHYFLDLSQLLVSCLPGQT